MELSSHSSNETLFNWASAHLERLQSTDLNSLLINVTKSKLDSLKLDRVTEQRLIFDLENIDLARVDAEI